METLALILASVILGIFTGYAADFIMWIRDSLR